MIIYVSKPYGQKLKWNPSSLCNISCQDPRYHLDFLRRCAGDSNTAWGLEIILCYLWHTHTLSRITTCHGVMREKYDDVISEQPLTCDIRDTAHIVTHHNMSWCYDSVKFLTKLLSGMETIKYCSYVRTFCSCVNFKLFWSWLYLIVFVSIFYSIIII